MCVCKELAPLLNNGQADSWWLWWLPQGLPQPAPSLSRRWAPLSIWPVCQVLLRLLPGLVDDILQLPSRGCPADLQRA